MMVVALSHTGTDVDRELMNMRGRFVYIKTGLRLPTFNPSINPSIAKSH